MISRVLPQGRAKLIVVSDNWWKINHLHMAAAILLSRDLFLPPLAHARKFRHSTLQSLYCLVQYEEKGWVCSRVTTTGNTQGAAILPWKLFKPKGSRPDELCQHNSTLTWSEFDIFSILNKQTVFSLDIPTVKGPKPAFGRPPWLRQGGLCPPINIDIQNGS